MLLVRPTVNPEIQHSKLAVDIFSFVTNYFSSHVGERSYGTRPHLHVYRAGAHAST